MGIIPTHSSGQGIDASITCNPNIFRSLSLINQILLAGRGGSKVVFADNINSLPVEFFWPWRIDIVGSQSSFNMSNWYFQIKTS